MSSDDANSGSYLQFDAASTTSDVSIVNSATVRYSIETQPFIFLDWLLLATTTLSTKLLLQVSNREETSVQLDVQDVIAIVKHLDHMYGQHQSAFIPSDLRSDTNEYGDDLGHATVLTDTIRHREPISDNWRILFRNIVACAGITIVLLALVGIGTYFGTRPTSTTTTTTSTTTSMSTTAGIAHSYTAILIDGGNNANFRNTNITQIYTPQRHEGGGLVRQIVEVDFGLPHLSNAATATMHGLVYIIGGAPLSNKTVVFNPATNTTTELAAMNEQRHTVAAAALPDTNTIVVCGSVYGGHTCEQYEATGNTWQLIEPLPVNGWIFGHVSATLNNNQAYIFGGNTAGADGDDDPDVSNRTFTLGSDGHWTQMADMPVPLFGSAAIAVDDDTAMLCGGLTNASAATAAIASCYLYSAINDKWTTEPFALVQPRHSHSIVSQFGSLWCIGGLDVLGHYLQTVEVYNNGWQALPVIGGVNQGILTGYAMSVVAISTPTSMTTTTNLPVRGLLSSGPATYTSLSVDEMSPT